MSRNLYVAPLILALASACGGSPSPNTPSANAVDARVDWAPVDVLTSHDARGREVDEIRVRGGDVVRITTDAVGTVEVGERVKSGAGHAESWSKVTPEKGAIVVRATLLGGTILVPRGVAVRAHVARSRDPGFGWFELEDQVLAWAKGPLPAPYPPVAPAERVDFEAIAAIDRALANAVVKAKDRDKALDAAIAIRRVVGLRALRAIRPPSGFPYFYDEALTPEGDGTRKSRAHQGFTTWLVSQVDPMTVTVEGPRLLQVWSYGVRRDEDEAVKLRVLEGDRERATSSGVTPHAKLARDDSLETPSEHAELVSLRRAVVHVPPGKHTYKIEVKGGAAFVAASASKPVIHVGDALAGIKDEDKQLAMAERACGAGAPEICAMALALAGKDEGATWTSTIEAISPPAKALAASLAAGGPRDPTVALEIAAASGDEKALAALGNATLRLVDDGVRGAWLRGTARGTRWVVAGTPNGASDEGNERWLSLLFDKTDAPGCAAAADEPWTEIGGDERSFATTVWRNTPTIELMASVSCGAKAPVALEIDGATLNANPSSPLVKWHVLVKNETVRIRRTDAGDGHVWAIRPDAAKCGARWGFIGAPRVAAKTPQLLFDKKATAPGVEVWLRDGAKQGTVDVVSTVDPAKRVTVVATARNGFVAVDNEGHRWVRVARLGLPPWASDGAQAVGGDDVAVRAIVRAPKGVEDLAGKAFASQTAEVEPVKEAVPLDENKLIEVSRQILAAQAEAKGKKYLERAMLLAEGGAARAALEDARAAKVLGVKGPKGEDAIALVRASIRPKPKKPLDLPNGTKAYGIEPDFDPGAPRCAVSNGPRGKLAAVLDELKTADAAKTKVWDPSLAIKAFEAVNAASMDPRAPFVLSRALAGSRWQIPKLLSHELSKVQRPHESQKEGALDPDGDLRARVATGQPFDRASYATITEERPAKAALTGTGAAKARVEFACVARSPADVLDKDARCPIVVHVGDAVLKPNAGPDGRGSVDLPTLPPKGKATHVTIGLEPAPGRWAAIARIVFDQEVAGTTKLDKVGWVLMPPGLQWRWLVKGDQELTHTLNGPGLVRVDALAEPDETPKVVVLVDGKEVPIALDGSPIVVPVPKGGVVKVKSIGGTSTIALAERVAKAPSPELTAYEEAEPEPAQSEAASDPTEPKAVTSTALLDAGNPNALWKDAVSKSDRPLTPLEEALGTLTTRSMGRYGTLRDGDLRKEFADGYFEQAVGYRRRIETLGIWTGISGLVRARDGFDTWGGNAWAWTNITPLRLRLGGYVDVYGQQIDGFSARTIQPEAYAEFSAKLHPSFYLLPRAGFTGFYSNLPFRPTSLTNVDDDVYNGFRFNRPTLLYGQVMAWWVPYFNDIVFLRSRANWNPLTGQLSHAGMRPGAIFAFGNLDLGVYADATWFRATEGIRPTSKVDVTGVSYALYNLWLSNGSLDVQPGLGGRMRAGDGGWEVYALVNVFASIKRGLRDFASPELAFPEQFGGNVPWRGPAVGGTR